MRARLQTSPIRRALRLWACAALMLAVASSALAQPKRGRGPGSKAARAAASAPPSIAIEGPAQLVLGKEGEAELRVRAPDGSRFRLHANVGSVSDPTPVSKGVYRATYKAPAERFPQVALLAAISDDGSLFAQHRLELYGKAMVEVVSEPGAQVRVRIGSAVFGPVTADAAGRASIDITVPPGYPEATSVATDALGNEKVKPLPLGVPPLPRLMAVCPEHGQSAIVLTLDARGRPDSGAQLELAASRATVASTVSVSPGTYRVDLGVPEDVAAGEVAQLSVALRGVARARTSCELKIPLELPNALTVELSAKSVSAVKPEEVAVKVTLRYPGRRERASVPIQLNAELGELVEVQGRASSTFETIWRIPSAFDGKSEARLSVRAGRLTGQATLALVPGPIAALRASLDDDTLLADGRSNTQLTVWASDAHDNPAHGAQLTAAAQGKIGAFRVVGPGQYQSDYRAPVESHAQTDTIALRDTGSGVATQVDVSLRGVRAPLRVGVRGGYATNFARVAGPVVGLLAEYRLPVALQAFAIGVDAAYHRGSDAQRSADARETVDVGVDAVPLLASASYAVSFGAFEASFVAGAGVVLASTEVESETTSSVVAKSTSFAWRGALRGWLAVGPGGALLELGYLHSVVDTEATRGNLGGALLTVGYAIEFGR